MIFDETNEFSAKQAITVSAASTNVIDLGVDRDIGKGAPVELVIMVTTLFAGGTSIDAALETDDNSGFSSATSIWTSGAIATATLVKGYRFAIRFMPRANERYLRIYYTVVGTMSAGNIQAGLVLGDQSNAANV